jgi:hypothetical protein
MTEPSGTAGELPDAFTLWGVPVRMHEHFTGGRGWWGSTKNVFVAATRIVNPDESVHWRVCVQWNDGTMLADYGHTFAEARRNCQRLLSERSREVGHVV